MKIENNYPRFIQAIKKVIPADRIFTDRLHTIAWGTDASFYKQIPQVVLYVQSEKEVSEALKLASRLQLPVTFRASGTSLSGQSITHSILIQLSKDWNGFRTDEKADTIVVQPAVLGERINQLLRSYGKKFSPDPASIKSASVAGIIVNNASGMSCSTTANSDKVIVSARIVFSNGMILDTGNEESRRQFRNLRPGFIEKIEELRDRVRKDTRLYHRIKQKYSIKNVVGLNILPFVEHDDPFDIITHLLVGSEGTLAFLSEATLKTETELPCKATALLYCPCITDACRLVQKLKTLPVQCAELFDETSLRAVAELLPDEIQNRLQSDTVTAVLMETRAADPDTLKRQINQIMPALDAFSFILPPCFTTDKREQIQYWNIRSGIFPSVGGMREKGTTCLIEDVAFPLERLPEATIDLQNLIKQYHYTDGAIYGHALDGNYHFILNQRFDREDEVKRYEHLMNDVAELVVGKYDGSLKAEHGTGRNMAPYVQYEWGEKAFKLMQEVKALFDPDNLLNPGVIFNDDPPCHVKNFKQIPVLNNEADKCIECGFCEPNCMSNGLTLSSRQRIVLRREIAANPDPAIVKELEKSYRYNGEVTCAGDGLCSLGCPMKINVAEITHALRAEHLASAPLTRSILQQAGNSFASAKNLVRNGLHILYIAYRCTGKALLAGGSRLLRRLSGGKTPLWTPYFPKPFRITPGIEGGKKSALKVVYFPSCINQAMGNAVISKRPQNGVETTIHLLQKAGYEVIFPEQMENLCCGTIWESKGLNEMADQKAKELEKALIKASQNGLYPILCDQSPCLYRMRHTMPNLTLYEPVEFIDTFLCDKLDFHPKQATVAVHATCSTKKMGLEETLVRVAARCASKVVCPEEVNCCGFAGDKGFMNPEVNAYALRRLRERIKREKATEGYSNSRTCEIGLSTHAGIEYVNIVFLVDECTTAKQNG